MFSIILPAFNAAPDLKRSLASVLAQRDAAFEIWVIDGASTDGTRALLESYGDQIRWISEPDGGVYDAMNKGIARARGEFVYFLGAGDLMRPDVLSQLAPHARALRQPALLYGDVWLCAENERFGGPFSPAKLRSWNPSHQAIFYGRAVFDRLGLYDARFPTAADYAFNLACWGDDEIIKEYVPLVIADYQGGGLSARAPDAAFERAKLRLIGRHLGRRNYWLRRLETAVPAPVKRWRLEMLKRLRRAK